MTVDVVPWRYATQRTPTRRSYGAAVGKLARALGTPLMPWQQHVADVALEVLDDGSWAYRTVVVTIQRQAGKTTLVGPVHLHRSMIPPQRGGKARTWFTAQSRQDARDTWLDIIETVRSSPLAKLAKVRESNGSESCGFAGGGYFRVFAPAEDALHGKANQLVTVDETWAFDAAKGQALEQAIRPTFTTTGGQLWLVSTAGTAASTWLRGYVDRGRAGVDAGRTDTVAYFECGLTAADAELVAAGLEDDAAPELRERAFDLVLAAHPAYGAGGTVERGAVVAAADAMKPGEFLRAYGNYWTEVAERAVPAHLWDAAGVDANGDSWPPPPIGDVALAFDVAPDRSESAIMAAWRSTPTAPLRWMLVDAHPGTSWVAPRLVELRDRWRPVGIGHDGAGPALDVADEARRAGVELTATNLREYGAACQGTLAAIADGRLEHPRQPALDDAVEAAATRPLGTEGAWAWSRRLSSASIAPLVAGTVAGWVYDHRPEPAAPPVVASRARRHGTLPPWERVSA